MKTVTKKEVEKLFNEKYPNGEIWVDLEGEKNTSYVWYNKNQKGYKYKYNSPWELAIKLKLMTAEEVNVRHGKDYFKEPEEPKEKMFAFLFAE